MAALYGVLGFVLGIVLAETFHRRVGQTGAQSRAKRGRGPAWASAARTSQSSGRFTAQDYYDR